MKISMIVAFDNEGGIGKNNNLPWHLPAELAYVKEKTVGKTIVMGRKNFESIGRALPNRRNIVMTRDKSFDYAGIELAGSIIDVLNMCFREDEVIIFGGQQVYELFVKAASKLYVTKINHTFGCDTFFPVTDFSDWREVSKTAGVTDEKNPYEYTYYIYEK